MNRTCTTNITNGSAYCTNPLSWASAHNHSFHMDDDYGRLSEPKNMDDASPFTAFIMNVKKMERGQNPRSKPF